VQGKDLDARPWPEHVDAPPEVSQLSGRWVNAGDLCVGDLLYLKSGEVVAIEEIEGGEGRVTVYNFHVEELESYAVGSCEIFVHNSSTRCYNPWNEFRSWSKGAFPDAKAAAAAYRGRTPVTSPRGLNYGNKSPTESRIQHVLAHGKPDLSKPKHTVFKVPEGKILATVDEAWHMKGSPVPGDPGKYEIPMGRVIGTAGETTIRIIVRPGTNEIITAYPI
jgi:hypothetical protein